jgi:hypothetical protein
MGRLRAVQPAKFGLDIFPYVRSRMDRSEWSMPTLRTMAEMGLLVGAFAVILVLASVVL